MTRFRPVQYEIQVEGHLDRRYTDLFEDFSLRHAFHHGEPITVLSGLLADQSALHGLLGKLQALGIVLLKVNRLEP